VKLNFFKGASLKAPKHLFNAGLEAKATRAIDFSEGANLNAAALKDLIRAAVAYNLSAKPKKKEPAKESTYFMTPDATTVPNSAHGALI
jgi:hypothetical protein